MCAINRSDQSLTVVQQREGASEASATIGTELSCCVSPSPFLPPSLTLFQFPSSSVSRKYNDSPSPLSSYRDFDCVETRLENRPQSPDMPLQHLFSFLCTPFILCNPFFPLLSPCLALSFSFLNTHTHTRSSLFLYSLSLDLSLLLTKS